MDRRSFIKLSGLAGGGAVLSAPAVAQRSAAVAWRCASSFDPSLPVVFDAARIIADTVSEMSDGQFTIEIEEPSDPSADLLAQVSDGDVEMLHTAPHYFTERDAAFAFGSGLPFGMNRRLTDAWLYEGGGMELLNQFFASYNVMGFPAGNTGAQMGGWFNREINTLDDLSGVRFRIGGFGSRIIASLGVIPQSVPPTDLVEAFENDAIDAAEFAGPAEDMALGLHRVARYLYYPGWWEGGISLMALVNFDAWNALSESRQAMLRHAAVVANLRTVARYDAINPAALGQLVEAGTVIRPYANDIMEAAFAASERVYRDLAEQNSVFDELLVSYMAYRKAGYDWFRRSEYAYDTFLMMLSRGGRL